MKSFKDFIREDEATAAVAPTNNVAASPGIDIVPFVKKQILTRRQVKHRIKSIEDDDEVQT
jgi:hypothetical protein